MKSLAMAVAMGAVMVGAAQGQITKKTEAACKKMISSDSAATILHDDLINYNFRIDDLVFVNGAASGNAYNKAKNQYGDNFFTGLQVDYKCSGSVVVFVDAKNHSRDQVTAIYNKLIGFIAVGLTKAEVRPLDREVETDGTAHF